MQGFAAPFQISHPPIGALLQHHTMQIPDLQRPFAWKKTQARELCSDLERLLEAIHAGRPDPQHFFGTLVVLTTAGQRDDIIDGQQRMTTITLMLGLIEASFRELEGRCTEIARANGANNVVRDHHENLAREAGITASVIHSLVWFSVGFTDRGEQHWLPRVKVSPEISETYQSLISGESGRIAHETSQPAVDLRDVADVFLNRLIEPEEFVGLEPRDQFRYLDNLLKVVRDGLVLVRLATSNAHAGYELFESLNARGVHLNALDHLKVWMLSVFAEARAPDSHVASAMRRLSSDVVEDQIDFVQDFYKARTQDFFDYDGLNNPKPFVAKARRLIFHDPKMESKVPDALSLLQRIEHEVDYLVALEPFWRSLVGLSETGQITPESFHGDPDRQWIENRLSQLFNTLGHQQGYPFMMVAAEKLSGDGSQFGRLVHMIEKFFFRFKTICGVSESKVSEVYRDLLRIADSSPKLHLDIVAKRLDDALVKDARDEVFRTKLVEKLKYGNKPAILRTKYFFEMLDAYSYATKPLKRAGVLKFGEWHLEHIVPQNPAPGDPALDELTVDSLGNLCLLPPPINTALSNRNYREKQVRAIELRDAKGIDQVKIGLADSEEIFYNRSATEWTPSDVADRIKYLQDFACQVFVVK